MDYRGFSYLVAAMDWAMRFVLSWRLSNTMDAVSLECTGGMMLAFPSSTGAWEGMNGTLPRAAPGSRLPALSARVRPTGTLHDAFRKTIFHFQAD